MIQTIYLILTIYFILGAIGFFFINRKKPKAIARESWVKYITYFVIIQVIFFSITIDTVYFQILCLLILMFAVYELVYTHLKSGLKKTRYVSGGLLIIAFSSLGLWNFSQLSSHMILFVFILLSIFDSFSQISGQLFGKHKICPQISPKKSYEGLIGGLSVTLISGFVLQGLFLGTTQELIVCVLLVAFSAFIGDLMASLYKRKYAIKDYSRLIPGHGGVLDRFDSLIGSGTFIGYLYFFI